MRSCDLDEARSVGGDLYYPHDVRVLGDRPFRLDLEVARLGPITLGWLSYNTEVHIRTGVLTDAYQVNIPVGGTVQTASGSERVLASPTRAAVYRPDRDSQFRGWATPCRMLAIKVDRHALEGELESLLDRSIEGPIQISAAMDLDGGRGGQWWSLVQTLASQMRDTDALAWHPLLGGPLVRSVLSGLLLSADHDYRGHLDSLVAPARPAVVRRAVEYIEQHAAEAVTVNDIAAAAGIGIRALQQGFQASLGTTPLTYLRKVRLDRARDELLRSDPETVGVAEVAFRWGFSHLGRFAGHYREAYDESPSHTLRRAS
ncbi:Transcriptional activator NphR [Pseudonocardia autotrophica]|nr:Transcriptional activator NphR [Pseudonocardia autotrophica]